MLTASLPSTACVHCQSLVSNGQWTQWKDSEGSELRAASERERTIRERECMHEPKLLKLSFRGSCALSLLVHYPLRFARYLPLVFSGLLQQVLTGLSETPENLLNRWKSKERER